MSKLCHKEQPVNATVNSGFNLHIVGPAVHFCQMYESMIKTTIRHKARTSLKHRLTMNTFITFHTFFRLSIADNIQRFPISPSRKNRNITVAPTEVASAVGNSPLLVELSMITNVLLSNPMLSRCLCDRRKADNDNLSVHFGIMTDKSCQTSLTFHFSVLPLRSSFARSRSIIRSTQTVFDSYEWKVKVTMYLTWLCNVFIVRYHVCAVEF